MTPTTETQDDYLAVHVMMPAQQQALILAHALIEEKLAACANILPAGLSVYRWDSVLHEESEILLIAKTTRRRYPALEERVRTLHPHECPCIVAFPITTGYQPYLDWLTQETAP